MGLEHVPCQCRLGVTAEERKKARTVFIDIAVNIKNSSVTTSDSLSDTVDYTKLRSLAEKEAKRKEWRTIEGLAGNVLAAAMRMEGITGAEVTVRKPDPAGLPRGITAMVQVKRGIP